MTNDETTSILSAERERSRADLVGEFQSRTVEESAPELLPFIYEGARVLDVGCGPGTITMGVANAIAPGEVVGIDPSEYSIAEASRHSQAWY